MDTTPQPFKYIPMPTRTATVELLASSAPPVRWVIPDYIGEGLTILAGRQNSGKSWLALDWALAVARGGSAMGAVACETGDVLYVDLENGERRIRSRLDAFFSRGKPPRLPRLEWLNEAPPEKNLVEILEDWRLVAENPRLVVIDAPQSADHRRDDLDGDVAVLKELRRWATGHPVAVVCLLRTRKAARDMHEAPANAIFACADAVLLLDRNAGGVTLGVCGRDVAQKQMALEFAKGRWSLLGEQSDVSLSAERTKILDVLRDQDRDMYPRQIAEVLDVPSGNVRRLLFSMVRDGEVTASWLGLYRVAE